MRFLLVLLVVFYCFIGCKKSVDNKINVSNITVDLKIERFENDFYNATEKSLPDVKKKYPYLFPESITDSIAISKITNKDEIELYAETQKEYKDVSSIQKELTSLFKHIKYYKSTFEEPKVITMLSNIDYESRVVYADSLLLISLDVYLGKEHPFYSDYPKYIKENNTKEHIIVDVANAIIATQIKPENNRTFIDKMIFEGKKMYLLDRYLPEISAKEKLGYSKEKMNWSLENEEQIWMYFIEKKLLFSTATSLNKRFIDVAPFSKFYTSADNDSPGRIGVFIGWQIVKDFMLNNDVSLQELLNKNSEEIFKKSNYKPRK
jgi:gliding motility-associated lipoprotein GldB